MGACTFATCSYGTTAQDAFQSAVDQAQYDHGHSYSGTVGEKSRFKMFTFNPDNHPSLNELIDELTMNHPDVSDKWGPAGCIDLGKAEGYPEGFNKYIFFGWASS